MTAAAAFPFAVYAVYALADAPVATRQLALFDELGGAA